MHSESQLKRLADGVAARFYAADGTRDMFDDTDLAPAPWRLHRDLCQQHESESDDDIFAKIPGGTGLQLLSGIFWT